MGSLNHRWTNLVTGVILEDQIEDFVNVFLSLLVGVTSSVSCLSLFSWEHSFIIVK